MAITLGGAGGGSEINDNKVINSGASLITTASGEKWLQSGTLDSNTSTYPDATSLPSGATYTNTNWSVASQMALPSGITWDGNFFYVCDRTYNGFVYKYNSSGVYQNTSFTSNGGENNCLTWDGTYFYMGNTDGGVVYRYNSSWTLQSGWSIPYVAGVVGVAVIGTTCYVYVQSSGGQPDVVRVYTITSSGGTLSTTFATNPQIQGQPQDLTTDGTYLYAISRTGVAFQYTTSGVYTGSTFSVNPLSSSATDFGGVTFKGTELYSTNATDDKVFQFNVANSVGLGQQVNTDGGTIYTRIL
jgi:hypothetical protein